MKTSCKIHRKRGALSAGNSEYWLLIYQWLNENVTDCTDSMVVLWVLQKYKNIHGKYLLFYFD